jgi:oligopeptide transport system permease protein
MQPFDDSDFLPLTPDERQAILEKTTIETRPTKFVHRFIQHTGCFIGLICLICILSVALLIPLFSPYTYDEVHLSEKNSPPSLHHFLGTDDLGRDLLTRVGYGLRLSLSIGCLAALLDMSIGISWGAIAGYMGGITDAVMMRLAELIYSIPYLLAVILTAAVVGQGLFSIIVALCFIGWIQMARLTRIQVLQIKQLDFVIAAHSLGIHPLRIVLRHILPNISGPLIAMLLLTIPQAIFAEAFLSFLGIGIQPPLASLGSMTSDALSALRFYPWRLFAPACTITLTIFTFTLLADGLRDLLDPKEKTLHAR